MRRTHGSKEMIAKNPMCKVDAPKKEKKSVDALTQEQAAQFFRSCLPVLLISAVFSNS